MMDFDSRGTINGTANGQQFLSSAGIDTQSLFRRAHDLQSKSNRISRGGSNGAGASASATNSYQSTATSTAPSRSASTSTSTVQLNPNLYESIDQSRAATIHKILAQERNNTRKITQARIQKRLEDNFHRTLEGLGHVVHGRVVPGTGPGPGSAASGNGNGNTTETGSNGYRGQRDGASLASKAAAAAAVLENANVSTDWNSQFLQSHLQIFDPASGMSAGGGMGMGIGMGMGMGGPGSGNTFVNLAQIARENHHSPYQSAISLFETIAATNTSTSGSSSSSLPLSTSITPGRATAAAARGRTIASLQFLARQFESFIVSQVKNNSGGNAMDPRSRGAPTSGGGLTGYIRTYTEMEMGTTFTASTVTASSPFLWKMMYYALRCGDLECVREIMCNSGGVVEVEDVLVRYMTQVCANGNTAGIEALESVPSNLVDGVVELYQRVESRSRNRSVPGGEYELAVLALLSFTPLEHMSVNVSSLVQRTSEDYVFMGLWNAIRSGNGSGGQSSVGAVGVGVGVGGNDDGDGNCVEKVCALADDIRHYGPEHFEDGDVSDQSQNDGWVYGMLLLLCQQYKSGLGYLAGKSMEGLCVAVHLGLALQDAGISLTDLTLHGTNDDGTASANAAVDDLATLIMAFAKCLQNVSPTSAVNYLVYVPGGAKTGVELKNGRRLTRTGQDQISRLILDTKAFAVLGGQMAPDGSRLASGALDKHFSKKAVSDILSASAGQSVREGNIADTAELLSLAGKYSDLLLLLNRQLSNLLVTDNVNDRNFWRDAAVNFHGTYLAQGQNHVLQVLESEHNLSLGNTFQMLLNLMSFFDRCNDGNWEVS